MFRASAEAWRPRIMKFNDQGVPVDFAVAWEDYESAGNAAALGSQYEVGIFQINCAAGADGYKFGATVDNLHRNFAAATSQKAFRALTEDEKDLQVTTGLAMINAYAELSDQQLEDAGADWPRYTPSFWAFVKLHHGLPALCSAFLPAFVTSNGRAPADWAEFASYLENISHSDAYAIHAGAAKYWGDNGLPGFGRFTHNAWESGKYGGAESLAGFPINLALLVLVAGALFAFAR
jgi:hypothetical protein